MRNLHLFLTGTSASQKKVEISQNFVAFSEYMNFKKIEPFQYRNTEKKEVKMCNLSHCAKQMVSQQKAWFPLGKRTYCNPFFIAMENVCFKCLLKCSPCPFILIIVP